MTLPLADIAVVDSRKLRDYLLSPDHPVGRHKARCFAVRGMLRGPAGREAYVVTVWIIRPSDPRPYLVTAYPGVRP